jgi:AcrR family transcriptional regulator
VPNRRTYDASRRRAKAAERREAVLDIARRRFLAEGYGTTSLAAIAEDAGVSLEYLHKSFGGKAGLVRAIYERSLLGTGPTPAPQRSDSAQATEHGARELFARFGAFVGEVAPLAAPMQLLIRDAAAGGDASMTALLQEVESQRYDRMLHNARQVAARGFLPPGRTAERAADVFWAITGPELFESLVLRRGWSNEDFGRFVGESLAGALLD